MRALSRASLVSLLALTTFCAVACRAGPPLPAVSYEAGQRTPAPEHPNFVDAGDVDGDGHADLAVAGTVAGEIWVYRGLGDGALVPPQGSWRLPAAQATHVLVMDVDGEPPDEIVAPLPGDGGLAVWGWEGEGELVERMRVEGIAELPSYVAVADVDGDGAVDAVLSDVRGDALLLVRGFLVPGAELAAETLASVNGPEELVLADVTGDGVDDLLAAVSFEDRVAVLAGDGAGGFAPWASIPAGEFPMSVLAADTDADGSLDVVTAAHLGATLSVAVDAETGAGDWQVTTALSCVQPICLRWVGTGDDVAPALYHACKGESSVAAYTVSANGLMPVLIDTVLDPGAVALADLDGDRVLDLVIVSSSDSLLEVRRGVR